MKKTIVLLILALLALICRADVWQFQCDAGHTGVSPDAVVVNNLLWQDSLAPLDISSGPVTCGDSIFMPTRQGLYCLNAVNGDSIWFQPGEFSGVPAIISDRVVAVQAETLRCFTLAGNHLWSLGFPGTPYTPTVVGESIFLACGRKVYALDTAGNSLWVSPDLPRSIVPNSAVCCYDSFVVATTVKGLVIEPAVLVYRLNRRTGAIVDHGDFGYGFNENSSASTATVSDGRIYFSTPPGLPGSPWLRAAILPDRVRWEYSPLSRPGTISTYYASSAVADGRVFFVGDGVQAYDTSGTRLWTADIGRVSYSSPIISAGIIWLGNDAGEMFGVDAISGLVRQRFQCGSAALTSPATTSGKLVIADISGYIYCFGYVVAVEEERRPESPASGLRDGRYDITGRRSSGRPPNSGIYFRVEDGGGTQKVVCLR